MLNVDNLLQYWKVQSHDYIAELSSISSMTISSLILDIWFGLCYWSLCFGGIPWGIDVLVLLAALSSLSRLSVRLVHPIPVTPSYKWWPRWGLDWKVKLKWMFSRLVVAKVMMRESWHVDSVLNWNTCVLLLLVLFGFDGWLVVSFVNILSSLLYC